MNFSVNQSRCSLLNSILKIKSSVNPKLFSCINSLYLYFEYLRILSKSDSVALDYFSVIRNPHFSDSGIIFSTIDLKQLLMHLIRSSPVGPDLYELFQTSLLRLSVSENLYRFLPIISFFGQKLRQILEDIRVQVVDLLDGVFLPEL